MRDLLETIARGAALIVTDRRWGATLSAAALGFGLFVGVAIGPGAAGTLATGAPQLIALPSLAGDGGGNEVKVEAGGEPESLAGSGAPLAASDESSALEPLPLATPLASESSEALPPIEEPAPEPESPPAEEEAEGPELETAALSGTVVHANQAAGSYTLAIKGGELVPVHAAKLPRPGTKLSLEGLRLANGTFAETGVAKRKGQTKVASFRGIVTHLDPDPATPAYTVSGRGASLLVSVPPDPTGAVPPLSTLGTYVTVEAAIEGGAGLLQRKLEAEPGEPSTYLDLSGIYAGLSAETGQLLLSSDDTRTNEQDLLLTVPPEIDTAKLNPGDSYLATAAIEPDGTLTLAGITSDEHRKGADEAGSAQGDLKR